MHYALNLCIMHNFPYEISLFQPPFQNLGEDNVRFYCGAGVMMFEVEM